MRRAFCLILAVCLLISGCSLSGERMREPVTFYYPRRVYQYGVEDGVIAAEQREASGHRKDLSYLLALYLIGPTDESLYAPLPRGVRFLKADQQDDTVTLELTDTTQSMTEAEFTLACACLTMTCLSITDAESVTILSGSRTVTMSRDNLTLYDNSTEATEETK